MKHLTILMMTLLFACKSQMPLSTVEQVDLNKYTGTWYEIARLPNSFEKGLKCTTANYSLNEDGSIKVVNKGHKISEPSETKQSTGKAIVPDKADPGKLKVSFQWPFYGKYWIIYLDEEYENVLVGTPSRKYLWILSRNKQMDEETLQALVEKARLKNFDVSQLIYVDQDCH